MFLSKTFIIFELKMKCLLTKIVVNKTFSERLSTSCKFKHCFVVMGYELVQLYFTLIICF